MMLLRDEVPNAPVKERKLWTLAGIDAGTSSRNLGALKIQWISNIYHVSPHQ